MTTHSATRAILIGDDLLVEVSPQPDIIELSGGEAEDEGLAGNNAGNLADRLEEAGDRIGRVCTTLQAKAFDAIKGSKPDEFEIEFGVTLAGEVGIPMVSKGSAECEFKVRATWKLSTTP